MSYGYGGWAPYVSVAQRRAKAAKAMNKLKKTGREIQPVLIEGKGIAKTFWGKGWCEHLEQFSDYANRLPRGRTYVRNGSVCHLKIQKGKIEAIVSGSELYKIKINIKPLSKNKWHKIKQQCSGQIGSMLELLQGKLSDNIMNVVTHPTEGLFPLANEIELDCNCPDWADLCKHLAAVLYGVGVRLDESPELLFLLRGVDHTNLITEISIPVNQSKTQQSKKRQPMGNLSDLFGIELDDTIKKPAKKRAVKKKVTQKKTQSRVKSSVKKVLRKTVKKTVKQKNIRPTGKTILRLRTRFGMSLAQFAQLLSVSSTTISNWEKKSEQLNLKADKKKKLLAIIDLTKDQAWKKLK